MRGKKRAIVVGAGPAGLAATKELLQEGHDVLCFEQREDLGGVFSFDQDGKVAGVWETCRLTSSILVTSFSDYFPRWREPVPFEHRHMAHGEYVEYLRDYALENGVLERVRFGTEVIEVAPDSDGWRVGVRADGEEESFHVDAVAICSGIHREPYIPSLPGLERFQGQVLHAAHYRRPDDLEGGSAVFIGAGESGSEIIGEASRRLDRSYLSLRRGVFVIPRMLLGVPNDYCGTRVFYSLPAFLNRRTDPAARRLRRIAGAALLPIALLRGVLARLPHREKCGESELFFPPPSRAHRFWSRWRRDEAEGDRRVGELISELRERAGGNQFETFATKTEAFVEAIADGRCELRPGVREITPNGVVFTDGTEVETDSIVFCTGYKPASIPALRLPGTLDLDALYKHCFDPVHRESLAFIGFLRPPIGAIPPMAEMQSRWWAQLLSGNDELPSSEEMRADAERDRRVRRYYHRAVAERLPHMVDFSTYMDDIAARIGAKPRLAPLLLHPRLLYKLLAAPFASVQYRLQGPHARPEVASRILRSAPTHESAFMFAYVAAAELAGLLGIKRLRPALSLIRTRPGNPLEPDQARAGEVRIGGETREGRTLSS